MRSADLDVAIHSVDLIFNICIPVTSISTSLNDDWVDSIEVSEKHLSVKLQTYVYSFFSVLLTGAG